MYVDYLVLANWVFLVTVPSVWVFLQRGALLLFVGAHNAAFQDSREVFTALKQTHVLFFWWTNNACLPRQSRFGQLR